MLQWMKGLFGPPSVEDLAHKALAALKGLGWQDLEFDAPMREIRGRRNGSSHVFFLGNLFVEYARTPNKQRHALLMRFLDSIGAVNEPETIPAAYADAKPRVLPIIRTRADEHIALLSTQRLDAKEIFGNTLSLPSKSLVGELVTGFAFDTPNATMRITATQLEQWGVSLDQVLDDALQNLRALPEHGGWIHTDAGVWFGSWGDSYESSRILLKDLIWRLEVADPVAVMPLRNSLLVCSARNEAGLAAIAAHAQQLIETQPRRLSIVPIHLVGDHWEVFTPPVSCRAAFHRLEMMDRAEACASQKSLLDDLHARNGTDVFVATATLFEKDGQIGSYATWTEGVDTLLPKTEWVVFNRLDNGQIGQSLFVPWENANRIVGELMSEVDMAPERFRVTSFPDATQWASLEASAQAVV